MRKTGAIDRLNRLYERNAFHWNHLLPLKIPETVRTGIKMIPAGLWNETLVAEQVIQGFWTFKIPDEKVGYLCWRADGIHLWADPKFGGITPNAAMARMVFLEHGVPETQSEELLKQMDIAMGRNPEGGNCTPEERLDL